MRLIKDVIERRERSRKHSESSKIEKFLNAKLPCENIVKLTNAIDEDIYVLMEYSPSVMAMLLNTNADFNCKVKVLSGRYVGCVYDINRYHNMNPSLGFELTSKGKLKLSVLGCKNDKIETNILEMDEIEIYFGDTVTVKDLIKYIKRKGIKRKNLISKNLRTKEMVKRLYESEAVILNCDTMVGQIAKKER